MEELTQTDLEILEAMRLERFRALFAEELSTALIALTLDNRLVIHCDQAATVDALLVDPDNLAYFAWLITGAERIALYCVGEEIWSFDLELVASLLPEMEPMATATLERTTAQSQTPTQTPTRLPIETVAKKIAGITGQDEALIINNILQSRPQMSFENGTYLVPGDAGDSAIDQWANDLKAKLRQPIASEGNGKVEAKPTTKAATKPATKAATKSTARRKPATKTAAKRSPGKSTAKKES